jgi:hypothetical protein
MSDHYHYEYAEARHDHRGDYADARHEHGYYELSGVAEEHHRHYSLEHEIQSVAAVVKTLQSEVADLRGELASAYEAVRKLRDVLERIRSLEDWQPDYSGPDAAEDESWRSTLADYHVASGGADYDDEDQADDRCPDCGRASCTGEDCYWPDEAGIARPEASQQ